MNTIYDTHRPLPLIEIMGMAGSGKSTLRKLLVMSEKKIQTNQKLSRKIAISSFLRGFIQLRHVLWHQGFIGYNRFSTLELRSLLYLQATRDPDVFKQLTREGQTAVCFDQGPFYLLTRLQAASNLRHLMGVYRVDFYNNTSYETWWQETFNFWANHIQTVIWLDAPDAELLYRVKQRSRRHTLKTATTADTQAYIDHFRQAYRQLLAVLEKEYAHITVLRFDSVQLSSEQISKDVIAYLDTATHYNIP